MNTNKITLILLLLLPVFFTSCLPDFFVEGNRDITEEVRTVPDFTHISSSGSFNIYYEYSDEIEVTVKCESNLLIYIETVVYEKELKIRTPFNVSIRPHEPIDVYVKGPYVYSIGMSGSGLISTDTIYGDNLTLSTSGSGRIETIFIGGNLKTSISGSGDVDAYAECDYVESSISGSGSVYLEGEAQTAEFNISGSGEFFGYDFPVDELFIHISGWGDLYVNVIDYLETSISGSGNVYYIGDPEIKMNISGSGKVIDQN